MLSLALCLKTEQEAWNQVVLDTMWFGDGYWNKSPTI
jgi:hypothetical protein